MFNFCIFKIFINISEEILSKNKNNTLLFLCQIKDRLIGKSEKRNTQENEQ